MDLQVPRTSSRITWLIAKNKATSHTYFRALNPKPNALNLKVWVGAGEVCALPLGSIAIHGGV